MEQTLSQGSDFYSQLENLTDEFSLDNQDTEVEMVQVQQQTHRNPSRDSTDEILDSCFNSNTTFDTFDSSQDTQNTDSSSDTLKTMRTNRAHLARPRRRRQNPKSEIQSKIKGYWTKNFLPIGKNPHFKWLKHEKGLQFFKENPDIDNIRTKTGISMEDYLYLYSHDSLQTTWERFFKSKFLHREIMLSRADGNSKVVFFQFLHRFEQAYKTGVFDHIA